jgi:hypothetical protein
MKPFQELKNDIIVIIQHKFRKRVLLTKSMY